MNSSRISGAGIEVRGTGEALWTYRAPGSGAARGFAPPSFHVDGEPVVCGLEAFRAAGEAAILPNGVREIRFSGPLSSDPSLRLELVFRLTDDRPVVRFRYVLHSERERRLAKPEGRDELLYFRVSLADFPAVKEVRFSEFNHMVYSYTLAERALDDRHFENAARVMGPMLVAEKEGESFLVAYEHGSTSPDAYLRYHLSPERDAALRAVKGNYFAAQPIGPGQPYETVWMQCAAVPGGEEALAAAYRDFVLRGQARSPASRKPYVFYNTYGRQCRAKKAKGNVLVTMNEPEILREIETAHRMGVDVFVLDVGWFDRAGEWDVSTERFPNGLGPVKKALDERGMKLGLWFSTQAALASDIYRAHRDCAMSWRGEEIGTWSVWGAAEGQHLCLVSRYADAFAERSIRLIRELGVTYFKWDAFGHYGCDAPGHRHGDANATPEDRGHAYTFLFDRVMQEVADRIAEACPEAIVDFDVTEPFRNFGLGFLSSGKYFLMNDGPYGGVYDFPPGGPGTVFGNPGPARGWNCRRTLALDKWIPSVCTLVHYLPDEPASSQMLNIASLVLGHNGIWGDILDISEEGVARFGRWLGLYKQVRDDITERAAVVTGRPGENPEIYEKISARGRGVVCLFSNLGVCADARGGAAYVTRNAVDRRVVATEGATVSFDAKGRAVIHCRFEGAGAEMVFFGVEE